MNYTLKDGVYFNALGILTSEFERQGIDYALVGGAAIQARISDTICRRQKTNIRDAVGLEHLLRETKDFDITSNVPEETFVRYFNELQATIPNVSILPERARSKRMKIKGKEDALIHINYQTGPQDFVGLNEDFYQECIRTAQPLRLKYNGTATTVNVATPECIVTSKLTRSDPKDIWDIATLLRTMKMYKQQAGKFKESKVRDYLESAGRGEIFGRFGEIKRQILKE